MRRSGLTAKTAAAADFVPFSNSHGSQPAAEGIASSFATEALEVRGYGLKYLLKHIGGIFRLGMRPQIT